VDADLDGEGVVIDTKALEQCELAELGVGARLGEPPTEHATACEVRDPPHGSLPLAFLPLVVVGRHEDPPPRDGTSGRRVGCPPLLRTPSRSPGGGGRQGEHGARRGGMPAQARSTPAARSPGTQWPPGPRDGAGKRGGCQPGATRSRWSGGQRGEGGIHRGIGIWIVLDEGRCVVKPGSRGEGRETLSSYYYYSYDQQLQAVFESWAYKENSDQHDLSVFKKIKFFLMKFGKIR
jgi:hypothetical protein